MLAGRYALADETGPGHGRAPERRCLVTGAVAPKEALLRFVVGPDGALVPDVANRLPGRGLWLKAERDAVETARTGRHFAKATRALVAAPDGLADLCESLLAKRCLDLIGLARRAGRVAVGFDQVEAVLRAGKGGVLLVARDGAAGGRDKLRALAPTLPVIELFDRAELGRAVGREEAVHVVVTAGRQTAGLIAEAARLGGFRRAAPRS